MTTLCKYTEEALWQSYQFVRFNAHCLANAIQTASWFARNRKTAYSVDFSEIHPWIYPDIGASEARAFEFIVHSRSVKALWDDLSTGPLKHLPFTLAIGPQATFEVLESLWHADSSIERELKERLPEGVRAGSPQATWQYLARPDSLSSLRELKQLVGRHSVDRRVVQPVNRLLDLIDRGILVPLEDILPRGSWDKIADKGPESSDLNRLMDFFQGNPREKKEVFFKSPAHAKFHDTIDALALIMARDLTRISASSGWQSVMLTHTFRVICASRLIRESEATAVVHHPGAALYVAKIVDREGEALLQPFLHAAHAEAELLRREFESLPAVTRLKCMTRKARDIAFKDKQLIEIPFRVHQRLKGFQRQYYAIVDQRFFDLEDQPAPDGEDTSFPEQVTIDDVKGILQEARDGMEKARTAAKEVQKRLTACDTGLAGLWLPREGFAKDVTDWLNEI